MLKNDLWLSDISYYTVILNMLKKIQMQIVNIMGFVYDSTSYNMTKCKEKCGSLLFNSLPEYCFVQPSNNVTHHSKNSRSFCHGAPYT